MFTQKEIKRIQSAADAQRAADDCERAIATLNAMLATLDPSDAPQAWKQRQRRRLETEIKQVNLSHLWCLALISYEEAHG